MGRPPAVTRAVPVAAGPRKTSAVLATGVPGSTSARRRTPRTPTLFGWEVKLYLLGQTTPLSPDTAACVPSNKTIEINESTWRWLRNDSAALQSLADSKAEAVRQMKVTMWDGTPYAAKAAPDRKPAVVPSGIMQLCTDLQKLTADLAGLDATDDVAVTEAAQRYAKYRDAMAKLRAAFTEAEGSFELAQELLVSKMGVE